MSEPRFNTRKFTVNGEPVDIEDFITKTANGDAKYAHRLRLELLDLAVNECSMFGGGTMQLMELERIE